MPCRAASMTLIQTDPEPVDRERALRTRIADLEDLLALIDATADWADDGSIRRVLHECLTDCKRRLTEAAALH